MTPDYLSSHRNAGRQSITCSICHDFTQGRPAPNSNAPSCFSDVDTDCIQCHERGTGQYNSFNSGKHGKHVGEENIFCTICHDTQKLAGGHFVGLNTTGFEQAANQTIQGNFNYVSNSPSCGVGSIGNIECHEGSRAYDWFDDD